MWHSKYASSLLWPPTDMFFSLITWWNMTDSSRLHYSLFEVLLSWCNVLQLFLSTKMASTSVDVFNLVSPQPNTSNVLRNYYTRTMLNLPCLSHSSFILSDGATVSEKKKSFWYKESSYRYKSWYVDIHRGLVYRQIKIYK